MGVGKAFSRLLPKSRQEPMAGQTKDAPVEIESRDV